MYCDADEGLMILIQEQGFLHLASDPMLILCHTIGCAESRTFPSSFKSHPQSPLVPPIWRKRKEVPLQQIHVGVRR